MKCAFAGSRNRARVSEDAVRRAGRCARRRSGGATQLAGLLRENHPIYDGRGTATVVRMRGWILLALARAGLSDAR